jgi:hypothetical protein
MATTRPFTYNNGSTINGTEQLGNLAIGITALSYSGNPGGKKWWMGPDEDNRYIIGKDVPTEDWPTQIPEGDIGSVRFWATSTENDSEFINLTNKIGNQSFTTIDDCLNWLSNNGYWTNYPIDTDRAHNGSVRYYNTQVGGGTYLGTDYAIYSSVQNRIYAVDKTSYNIKVNPSNFTTSNEDLTAADGDYDVWSGNLGIFTLNADETFLYQGFTNPSNTVKIKKINTSTLATAATYSETNTVDNINGPFDIIYVSASNKVVMSHQNSFTNPGFISPAITIWDDDLNIESDRISFSNTQNVLSPHSTDSSFLWYDANNSNKYWVSDTEDITSIYTGSMTGMGFQFGHNDQPPINHPTNNDWYITGVYTGNQTAMAIIDGDTYGLKQIVPLTYETDNGKTTAQPRLAYDSNRDVIWTFTSQEELVAFDCSSNKVVKLIATGSVNLSPGGSHMTVDTTNNLLYIPKSARDQKIDLNDIWPI